MKDMSADEIAARNRRVDRRRNNHDGNRFSFSLTPRRRRSLPKAALEALTAASNSRLAGGAAHRRAGRRRRPGRGQLHRRLRRHALSRRRRRGVRAIRATPPMPPPAEALCRAAERHHRHRPATRAWRASCPAWRTGSAAASTPTSPASHVTDGAPIATRWYYRQRMEAVARSAPRGRGSCCVEAGSQSAHGRASRQRPPSKRVAVDAAVDSHHGRPASARPRPDEQTIRPDAKLLFVAGAGWTKKQADGQSHAEEAEQLILGFLREIAGLARRQQVAGGSERRRPGRAALHDPPEPGRPDRRHAAPSQRALHLLPRRRTARRRLAVHQRAPRRSTSTPTAAGRAARPTCSTSPTRSRS